MLRKQRGSQHHPFLTWPSVFPASHALHPITIYPDAHSLSLSHARSLPLAKFDCVGRCP